MKYYINVFLIYSMLGYVLETFMKIFFFKDMNNGILYGPWVPVYGFGTCLIIFIMRFIFNKIKVKRIIKIILLFLISTIVLTLLELIGGYLIEILTGKIFWDYSDLKFNIGHYIALEISLVWGIMSLVITYLVKPITDEIIKKIPNSITYLVSFLFIIDCIVTLFKIL